MPRIPPRSASSRRPRWVASERRRAEAASKSVPGRCHPKTRFSPDQHACPGTQSTRHRMGSGQGWRRPEWRGYGRHGENLLPADLPAPCYLRHHSSRNQRFSNNSRLLIRRPASPPIRTRQHLNTPINTLSAVFNVVHNSVSKPSLASKPENTSRINGEEGPSSIAYLLSVLRTAIDRLPLS